MNKLLVFCLFFSQYAFAQTITLEQVQQKAKQQYPLIKQKGLVKQVKDISIENLRKGFLPQLSLSGQATYQSEVTTVKIPFPGVNIEPLSKDQYKLVADVNQMIYDGGLLKQQTAMQQVNAEVEDQKIEVELYKLNERINQVYLSILYIDEQLKQTELVRKDLETGLKKIEAQVNGGVAFKSNLNLLKAELLKIDQRIIELQSTRTGLLDVLTLFTGENYIPSTQLEKPVVQSPAYDATVSRPEINLFQKQQQLLGVQNNLIKAKNLPKTSFFFQGGYGRPGLNFLENKFATYYVTGVRFNWAFGGLYTAKKEKELIGLNQQIIAVQQDVFLLNTNTQLKQQQAEIDKIKQLISKDNEIIDLRIKVKEAANAQLENGVITANDYLREVNAEDQARQTLILHQLQLLQAQINYQTIKGK
ncbi:outer membrane protein TolC [Lacibacter cauensis]|uniref:Outer membrane protein TolC n=1 Tax=Lacibacter cauensis TaxID=510947 RepID=A0A562SDP0_9BACT|nr:TolC family protein [Lacibacter cauensis]TWI79389.1 outer membrane protein TolC [Lacibacter cauensis]